MPQINEISWFQTSIKMMVVTAMMSLIFNYFISKEMKAIMKMKKLYMKTMI